MVVNYLQKKIPLILYFLINAISEDSLTLYDDKRGGYYEKTD